MTGDRCYRNGIERNTMGRLKSALMAVQLMLVEPNLAHVPKNPYNTECAEIYRLNKPLYLQRVLKRVGTVGARSDELRS